jgi:glycosyltransferase involved in cell wall biosynthesis
MLFWVRICEGQAVRKSDLNLTLTAEDRDLLYHHYDSSRRSRIEVVGVHEYKPMSLPDPSDVRAPVFIITGNLGAKQSEDSLIPWLDRYYPILKERVPSARLIFAGQAPSQRLLDKCSIPGIEVVDTPPEMQPVLRRARYYICPTDRGGGIKLRVMDGLRNGLPVLAHAVSARGYAPFLGSAMFSYSDTDSFRAALESLLSASPDPVSVQEQYRRMFSFEAGVERLSEWLDS